MNSPSEHQFRGVFQALGTVEGLIESNDMFIFNELDWQDVELNLPDILWKPARMTILHHFTFQALKYTDTYTFHHDDDFYESDYLESGYEDSKLARVDEDFYRYSIDVQQFQQFAKQLRVNGNTSAGFVRSWFDSQFESFIELWEKKTDEVFYFILCQTNTLTI